MNNTKKSVTANAFWIMLGRVFQIGITFVTTTLVARYLGPDKYGSINYAYSYVVIFSSFATLGLNDIVVKELLDKNNDKSEVLGTMIGLKLIASTISIGLIYLVVLIIDNNRITRIITFLQALSLMFQAFDSLNYFYQSSMLSNKSAVISIVAYALTAVFRIVGLVIKKDIKWFAFAVSLDFLVVSLLLLIVYYKDGYRLEFNKSLIKKLLSKSYNYIFASVMIGIYSKADTLLLGKLVDETNVGYYTAATTICNAWPFALQAIIDSTSPVIIDLHNKDKQMFNKRLKQLYASIFYVALFVGIIICVLSKTVIGLIYGIDYLPAAKPIKIVCWSTIFAYFGVARGIWMQCENKIKYEKVLYLFGAISDIVLNLLLIKPLGIVGAAIALTLTQMLTNFIYVIILPETRENGKLILDAIMLKGVFK